MSYNGWTNKETWLVILWYGDYFHDLADHDRHLTEEYCREVVEEDMPELTGFYADIMPSLDVVDWQVICDTYNSGEHEQ